MNRSNKQYLDSVELWACPAAGGTPEKQLPARLTNILGDYSKNIDAKVILKSIRDLYPEEFV